jgi:hypothetical protein
MSLILPPGVTRGMLNERQEREGKAFSGGVFVRDDRCREYDPLLMRADPYLRMVFCREPAPLEAVACGARPGRYNIVRSPPGAPVTFIPITGPDGEFVEPCSSVFEALKQMDWQDPVVQRERKRREEALEEARAKAEAEEMRRMDEEVLEAYLAGTRTQVSMNADTPWAQNAAGYKKVRGNK